MAIVDVKGVSLRFGGLIALNAVDLEIEEGQFTALVGPNGAGKTTLFNVISGFIRPDAGVVRLRGQPITGLRPQVVARMGLVRSFQDVRVFDGLTVLENVIVAAEASGKRTDIRDNAMALLETLGLGGVRHVLAGELSYAEQKFISFARMIATGSPVLLLDEPSSGLDEGSLTRFVELTRTLRNNGTTIVIVEHNLDVVRAIAERVAFLHKGEVLAYGNADEILRDATLSEVYLGGGL